MPIIVTDPRMAYQPVRARETFFATREIASEWLLPGVCVNVASLGWWLEMLGSDL